MLNSQQILENAQNGQAQPTWKVLPAKRSYFISNFIAYLLVIAAGFGLIAYLILNPNMAIVPKFTPDGLDDAALAMWRTIDMVVFPLIILGCAWFGVQTLLALQQRHEQLLVLLPEGVVMRKGKTTSLITFAEAQVLKLSNSSATSSTLTITKQNGQKTSFRLDNRFGNPRKLSKQIDETYKQYRMSNSLA